MLELKREPEVVFWVFVFPLLLALGLGIAFRNKPGDAVSVAIIEGSSAQSAQALLARSPHHDLFKIQVLNTADARKGFRLGKFDLVIEPGLNNGLVYRYDPARPESVLAKSEVNDALQAASGRNDAVATTAVTSSEPGSRYIDFLIPGLLGMNLMNSGMWGIGFALVDMRQRKLLKRYVGTPMRRGDFPARYHDQPSDPDGHRDRPPAGLRHHLLSHARTGFGVLDRRHRRRWDRSPSAGVGLLTASRAQKIESISGLINLVMMPMWIFSGVFFSYERFPAVIHPLIKALPLTALNDALRASILEGTPLMHQWSRLLILALWGGISFVLALKWFRWT